MNLATPGISAIIEAEIEAALTNTDPAPAMDEVFALLQLASEHMEPGEWHAFGEELRRSERLQDLLLQEPLTCRAWLKPRGYAGDAVMMDLLYGIHSAEQASQESSEVGRQLFRYIQSRPAAQAVRFRREHIAALIDETAQHRCQARVLSVACGHLREAELSAALATNALFDFLAVDTDPQSLAEVDECYGNLGVRTIHASVRQLLGHKLLQVSQFDFVYAAGLYDYLADNVAAALTARLFEITAPGGTLLVPNFAPELADRGYMEAAMDWRLIYRDEYDMHQLLGGIDRAEVESFDIYRDPSKSIVFLVLRKKASDASDTRVRSTQRVASNEWDLVGTQVSH